MEEYINILRKIDSLEMGKLVMPLEDNLCRIGSYVFNKEYIDLETGEFKDSPTYKNKYGRVKNNSSFINYLQALKEVPSEIHKYKYMKNTLIYYKNNIDCVNSSKANLYLDKLEKLNELQQLKYEQANKLYKKNISKIVKPNGLNKISNCLYNSSLFIIWELLGWLIIPLIMLFVGINENICGCTFGIIGFINIVLFFVVGINIDKSYYNLKGDE